MSGRRGSNPRPSAWKADALSTELLPQYKMSRWRDSNPRPADYKSAALANWATSAKISGESRIRTYEDISQRSYSPPQLATLVSPQNSSRLLEVCWKVQSVFLRTLFLSRWRDSNPRPADYKSAALANWATSAGGQATHIALLQPFTLAAARPWGNSTGASRMGLTRVSWLRMQK